MMPSARKRSARNHFDRQSGSGKCEMLFTDCQHFTTLAQRSLLTLEPSSRVDAAKEAEDFDRKGKRTGSCIGLIDWHNRTCD